MLASRLWTRQGTTIMLAQSGKHGTQHVSLDHRDRIRCAGFLLRICPAGEERSALHDEPIAHAGLQFLEKSRMQPTPRKITELATYRDGGSLSVSYVAITGDEFTIFFQVDWDSVFQPESKEWHYRPWLIQHLRTMYVSPVTGVASPVDSNERAKISWDATRSLLSQLQLYFTDFSSDDSWVFPQMVKIAELDGRLNQT